MISYEEYVKTSMIDKGVATNDAFSNDLNENQKISKNSLTMFNTIFYFGFDAVLFANVEASFDAVYATGIGRDNFVLLAFLQGENGDVNLEPRIGIFQHDVHITDSIVTLTMIWFKGKITYESCFLPYYYNSTFKGTALCALVKN